MTGRGKSRIFSSLALTPKQRAVLELYVQGLTYAQIGAQLAIHVSTVRNHVQLGVKKGKVLIYGDKHAVLPKPEADGDHDRPDDQSEPPD